MEKIKLKKKVILSKKFIDEGIELLSKEYELIIVEDNGESLLDVLKENDDAEAIISFLSDQIGKDIIDIGKNLKIISNYAVGYNNIDIAYAKKKEIFVTNTPDVLTEATADIAWSLIMTVSRKILPADKFTRDGNFKGWGAKLFLGKELRDSKIGIIGMGRIGTAVARRAKAFGMNISYFSRTRKLELEKSEGFAYKRFENLVKNSDILSLHLPYSEDVYHLFDKKTFDMMKKDAIFINVSRGLLMDESALSFKLKNKELFGAGLDVYEFEPEVTKELLQFDNVVLTPHIGSATYETRLNMAKLNIKDINLALKGKIPINLV